MVTSSISRVALAISVALSSGLIVGVPPARAADAADEPQGLQEVVVTARKREETLNNVSAAISVVGADELRNSVVNDVRQLQNITPELTVGEVVGAMKMTMRGLGNTSNTRGEDSEIAFYVDGAVVVRPEAQSLSMFDLDRVEVLRGPQGTLYGRNSTGGLINLITAKPTEQFTGYANVTAGNYSFLKVDGAVSGPITDGVLGRIAVESISRNGFGTNITTGNQIDDDHRWAARGQLQFNVSDHSKLLLAGEFGSEHDASGLFTYYTPLYVVGPPAPASQAPKGVGGFSDPNSRNGAGNIDPELQRETRSFTATYTWDIDENLTFKNIANWRQLDFYLAQDLDLSSVVPPPMATATVSIPLKDRTISEEAQLTWSLQDLTVIGGLYWFKENLSGTTYVGATPGVGIWFYRSGQSQADSYAGFFNANYQFNSMFTLRVGGRYNHDKRAIDSWQWVNGVLTIPPNSPTNPANDSRTDDKYTGEYGLDFHITDRSMLYYTFSQGYRQGAGVIMQVTNPIISPTTVNSNEVGYKFRTAGGRFDADVALYDMQIHNLQRTQAVPEPNGIYQTIINNIKGMKVKGVELDTHWSPVRPLILSGGAAYTDAKFEDFVNDDPLQYGIQPVQLAGNTPQLTPKWKAYAAAEYSFPLPRDAELAIHGDATYVGAQFFDEFDRWPLATGGYTLYDASLAYRPVSRNWSATLWGKNLSNEKKIVDATFSANGLVTSKKFIDPATYGVSINYSF